MLDAAWPRKSLRGEHGASSVSGGSSKAAPRWAEDRWLMDKERAARSPPPRAPLAPALAPALEAQHA